jgi:hypothetical protein
VGPDVALAAHRSALRNPHRPVILPGVGHDEILGCPAAWREIEAFLGELGPLS